MYVEGVSSPGFLAGSSHYIPKGQFAHLQSQVLPQGPQDRLGANQDPASFVKELQLELHNRRNPQGSFCQDGSGSGADEPFFARVQPYRDVGV